MIFTLKRLFKSGMALALAALLIVSCLLPAALAGEAETRTIRIGYIDYDGFIAPEADGSCSGYGVDLLNEIARYTGWQYEYVSGSWSDHLEALKSGEIDFLCQAQKTEEREAEYLFSKYSAGSESSVLYVRKFDARYYYEDYSYFDGMRIGFLKDSYQAQAFDALAADKGFSFEAVEFESESEAFGALNAARVDGVAMSSLAEQSGYKVVARVGADPYYFMTGRMNSGLMAQLDSALAQLHAANPTFEAQLYQSYYAKTAASADMLFTRAEEQYIADSGTITVGLMPEREPLSYAENGQAAGLTVDLMNLVARKTGLQFDYAFLENGETGADFLSRSDAKLVAGVMNSEFSPPNPALLHSDSLLDCSVVFVGKEGMEFSTEKNLTVALPAAFINGEQAVAGVYPKFGFYHAATNDDCLAAIRDGKADVTLQNMYVVRQSLQSPVYDTLGIFPAYSFAEAMEAVALPGNEMLISIINKAIGSFSDEETNDIVIANTIARPYKVTLPELLYKYRLPLIGILALFVVVLALCLTILSMHRRSYRKLAAINSRLAESNAQLGDAVAQAQHANEAKSQFLARMSHEIRTPMNAIVGLTNIARHHTDDRERMEDSLEKIETSSHVLLNIINDVLDMSAIESNRIKIASAEFDLKQVLDSIATVYYAQCRAKGVEFVMGTDISNEVLIGDSLRVNQVLLNLVSNAYKFTPEGGRIELFVREKERRGDQLYIEFTVSDTGCGMSEEMLGRLFKPFEQESAGTARKYGGSGLGLAISRNLVTMMHGAIDVRSRQGKGTTFTVQIPFGCTGETLRDESPDAEKLRELKALLVDDDATAREYSTLVLERIGVHFDTAGSGAEALEMLHRAHEQGGGYDVCLIDWKMPGMDGVELTRNIRREYDANTMIIIISAYDLSEIQEQARDAGANVCVTKPLYQSTVFNVLMQMSGGRYTRETADVEDCDFSGHRVLLAEDNELNSEIALELLGMVNMAADHAENGMQALEMFKRSAPGTYDAILMDIQMPLMDGMDATRAIRASAHPQARTIPIYAMTANAFAEDVSAALAVGMNGHISKPIDTDVLYSTLKKIIAGENSNG